MHNIKPAFIASPHPFLNLQTGRKLSRPAGGPMATQDAYEGQKWKEHPGIATTLMWCVLNIPVCVAVFLNCLFSAILIVMKTGRCI